MPENVQENDFVEISFTGFANGEMFDSNVPGDLKKINSEAKPEKLIVAIGRGMLVSGLDKALEGKELNKEYEVSFSAKEGFGERKRELIRVIPLKSFTEQQVAPRPGMVLALDNQVVKIVAVSGARVTTDFNNPLSGKNLKYKFKVIRKVTDEKEKAETLLKFFFRFTPEFRTEGKKVIIKLPKGLESMVEHFKPQFKEIANLELAFEEKKEEKKEKPSAE